MKRRDFLGSTFLASLTAAITQPFYALAGNNHSDNKIDDLVESKYTVFATESGLFGRDASFVLGLLVVDTSQVATLEKTFLQYRDDFKYGAKITFSSNDDGKEKVVKTMIDSFAKNTNMSFYAVVVNAQKDTEGNPLLDEYQVSFGKKSLKKMDFYKKAIQKASISNAKYVVKSQSPYGPSAFFKQTFNDTLQGETFEAVNTSNSNLLQLSGILTGCVRAEINDNTQNKVKISIKEHLKQVLGLKSLAIGTDKNKKFSIIS